MVISRTNLSESEQKEQSNACLRLQSGIAIIIASLMAYYAHKHNKNEISYFLGFGIVTFIITALILNITDYGNPTK